MHENQTTVVKTVLLVISTSTLNIQLILPLHRDTAPDLIFGAGALNVCMKKLITHEVTTQEEAKKKHSYMGPRSIWRIPVKCGKEGEKGKREKKKRGRREQTCDLNPFYIQSVPLDI